MDAPHDRCPGVVDAGHPQHFLALRRLPRGAAEPDERLLPARVRGRQRRHLRRPDRRAPGGLRRPGHRGRGRPSRSAPHPADLDVPRPRPCGHGRAGPEPAGHDREPGRGPRVLERHGAVVDGHGRRRGAAPSTGLRHLDAGAVRRPRRRRHGGAAVGGRSRPGHLAAALPGTAALPGHTAGPGPPPAREPSVRGVRPAPAGQPGGARPARRRRGRGRGRPGDNRPGGPGVGPRRRG